LTAPAEWPLGLAHLAAQLDRDLQRAARSAGGPAALWRCSHAALVGHLGLDSARGREARAARAGFDPPAVRRLLAEAGIGHVGRPEPGFLAPLAAIYDPPFGLFLRGRAAPALARLGAGPVVALVGSRRATAPGRAMARALAAGLAERGAVVVSGLAQGIDAAAHEGALAADGTTVAVLGCGVDVSYPRANRLLAARIVADGLLVSEYWPGTRPAPWRFPARERLMRASMRLAGKT